MASKKKDARPVITLHSWSLAPDEGELEGVQRASTPAEAVELALAHLDEKRGGCS